MDYLTRGIYPTRNIRGFLKVINDYSFNNQLNELHLENLRKHFSNNSILINNFICFTPFNKYTIYSLLKQVNKSAKHSLVLNPAANL